MASENTIIKRLSPKIMTKPLIILIAFVVVLTLLGHGAHVASQIPASTLKISGSSDKAPDEDGFIQRWFILEPISTNGLTDSAVQVAVKKEYFTDQFNVVPRDGDKVNVDGAELTWHDVQATENVRVLHSDSRCTIASHRVTY